MITVYGEGRGFRVVWLLEEMGLAYQLRPVDLLADVQQDKEFIAVNPAGYIPALQDGEVVMVESVAIMEYLLVRYGALGLAPAAQDPDFAAYLQFLHLGEAGLALPAYIGVVSGGRVAAGEPNAGAEVGREIFESRLGLVRRQLARHPYLAGAAFTAADISVTYALEFASRTGVCALQEPELAYVARTTGRAGYVRAMQVCSGTRAWAERVAAAQAG